MTSTMTGTPEENQPENVLPDTPDVLPDQRRKATLNSPDLAFWGLSKQSVYAVAVCFLFFYAFSYFATEIVQAPLFWYYPLEHRWVYGASPPKGLMMGWYGKVLLSLLIASLSAGLLALGLKFGKRELGASLQSLCDLAAMSMVLFVLYYIARSLAYRVL